MVSGTAASAFSGAGSALDAGFFEPALDAGLTDALEAGFTEPALEAGFDAAFDAGLAAALEAGLAAAFDAGLAAAFDAGLAAALDAGLDTGLATAALDAGLALVMVASDSAHDVQRTIHAPSWQQAPPQGRPPRDASYRAWEPRQRPPRLPFSIWALQGPSWADQAWADL